jgi:hypothetical protein
MFGAHRFKTILIGLCFFATSCTTNSPSFNPPTQSNLNNSTKIPVPSPTPTASPGAAASPSPSPSATPVQKIDGVPVPNHPMLFGYYFTDGRYGNFRNEVDCYTNTYIAFARRGYEPDSSATDDEWIPIMRNNVEANANMGKRIYLNLNMSEEGERKTPINRVLNLMTPYWNKVDVIELADEPNWTKAETESRIADLRSKIHALGLSDKPMGIVYTNNQLFNEDAIKAQGLDWVGVEAYVDAPGDANSQVNQNKLNQLLDQAKTRVPADKKLVFVMMAYARNGLWTNMNTLKDLQMPTYNKAYNDQRVLGVTMFSYGRSSGTQEHPELKTPHIKIGNAIQGTQCAY